MWLISFVTWSVKGILARLYRQNQVSFWGVYTNAPKIQGTLKSKVQFIMICEEKNQDVFFCHAVNQLGCLKHLLKDILAHFIWWNVYNWVKILNMYISNNIPSNCMQYLDWNLQTSEKKVLHEIFATQLLHCFAAQQCETMWQVQTTIGKWFLLTFTAQSALQRWSLGIGIFFPQNASTKLIEVKVKYCLPIHVRVY